jgi:hypothetical protein
VEYADVDSKEAREFFRAAETLIAKLQNGNGGGFSSYALLLTKIHIERLRSAVLFIENNTLLKTVREDRSRSTCQAQGGREEE